MSRLCQPLGLLCVLFAGACAVSSSDPGTGGEGGTPAGGGTTAGAGTGLPPAHVDCFGSDDRCTGGVLYVYDYWVTGGEPGGVCPGPRRIPCEAGCNAEGTACAEVPSGVAGHGGAGGLPGVAGSPNVAGSIGTAGSVGLGGEPGAAGAAGAAQLPSICDRSAWRTELTWGPDGGMVLFQLSSSLSAEGDFQLTRVSYGGAPDLSCTPPLPVCGGPALDLEEITRAVMQRDVQTALQTGATPLLFGHDSRPVDGTVTRISIAGRVIEVGGPCGSETGCTPIPAGIAALADTLNAVTAQQAADASCASVRIP